MIHFSNADKQVLTALTRMKAPEMRPLREFFQKLADDTDAALRRAKPDDFQKLQGRAQLLEEFLTAVEQSAEVLEKMR